MAEKPLRAVVVGASTLLGKELVEEINASSAAVWDLQLLEESEEPVNRLTAVGDEALITQPLTASALEGADLVFFAGEGSVAREFWKTAAKTGASVIDMTGALEGETGFLVRSPWVQGGQRPDLTTAGLVAAHPAAVMLALIAERLGKRFGEVRIRATVLEPASQAGSAGVDELHQQTVGLLSFQEVPKAVFDAQVAFNLQADLGQNASLRLAAVRETVRRHLGLLLPSDNRQDVTLTLVQAPVFHGYTISASVQMEKAASSEHVRRALAGGLVNADAETTPSNQAATESEDVLVSVEEESLPMTQHWVWLAADNLRLAARNALAAASELAALRPAARVQ